MAEDTALQIIDRQDWMLPVANNVAEAVGRAYEAGGDAVKPVKDFLHGTWLGHPLHAAVTDVPIGAWTASLALDAMSDVSGKDGFARSADAALTLGLAGAAFAAVAGVTDWHPIQDERVRKLGLAHGMLNVGGTLLYTASLIARKREQRRAGRGLAVLGYLVTMGAAYLGGKLAYKEQIGTDHSIGQQLPDEFTPVLAENELSEGQMRRVDAKGARVLVAKCQGQVYAINEVCAHFGGPLAEGELDAENCSVKCPWHGSQFSLKDGSLLEGPSVHPQPALLTRIRDGQIEVANAEKR